MTSSAEPHLPDSVRLLELDTIFFAEEQLTKHYRDIGGPRKDRGRVGETWLKKANLGKGTFGTVYLEECVEGSKKHQLRAVKRIERKENFGCMQELEAVALFSHEKYDRSFVKSYGWFANDTAVFITMEYLPYGDLQECMKSRLPESEAQDITYQILEGLRFMHDSGFAHLDLKPANILVKDPGPQWYVKITDFGLSTRAFGGVVATQNLGGTLAYMAPEVVRRGEVSKSDWDAGAVDMWSVGVMSFLMLTGEALFRDPVRIEQYALKLMDFPEELLAYYTVSQAGIEFIKRLLAPEPLRRPRVRASLALPWFTEDVATTVPKSEKLPDLQAGPGAASSASDSFSISLRQKPLPPNPPLDLDHEPSALWSTQKQPANPHAEHHLKLLQTLEGHGMSVMCVAFSVDGKLASGAGDKMVKLWDAPQSSCKTLPGHQAWLWSLAFSPDGKLLASCASGWFDLAIRIWDAVSGASVNVLYGHKKPIDDVAFSRDGKLLASGSYDCTVILWDVKTWVKSKTFEHPSPARAVAFSPDGKLLASGLDDKTIRLWDVATSQELKILRGHEYQVISADFSPNNKILVSGSEDKSIRLWDTETGEEVNVLKGNRGSVDDVKFSPDGRLIAAATNKGVILFSAAAQAGGPTLINHMDLGWVYTVAFSADGKLLASGSRDRTVRIWDAAAAANLLT